MLRSVSSSVFPADVQPGWSGEYAENPVSVFDHDEVVPGLSHACFRMLFHASAVHKCLKRSEPFIFSALQARLDVRAVLLQVLRHAGRTDAALRLPGTA